MPYKKVLTVITLFILTVMIFTGCATSKNYENSIAPSAYENTADAYSPQTSAVAYDTGKAVYEGEKMMADMGGGAPDMPSTGKIIRTANISMEVMDFDAAISELDKTVSDYGGYVQSSSVQGTMGSTVKPAYQSRFAYYTMRIPTDKLPAYLLYLGQLGNVYSREESGEDVSSEYYDAETRLKSLKIQEERLLELLKSAEDIEQIIQLEDRLSTVRYQIEYYTGTLKGLDNKINYCTVRVNITEVVDYTPIEIEPKGFFERMGVALSDSFRSFGSFLQNTIISVVYFLPYVILWLVVAGVIVWIILSTKKRKAKKKQGK